MVSAQASLLQAFQCPWVGRLSNVPWYKSCTIDQPLSDTTQLVTMLHTNINPKTQHLLQGDQSVTSPCQIHWLFQVFLTEVLIFIKPAAVYRHAYVYSWLLSEYYGTIVSPSSACQLYLTVLRLCLFCDLHITGKPQFPWIFLISLTFPWPMWNSRTFSGFPCG